MHHSLFSLASALAIFSLVSITSARVAVLSPREILNELDKRLVCLDDSYNSVFKSVGMGTGTDPLQNDIDNFCKSWIGISPVTSYYVTVTPTTTLYPATVTVESTTEVVLSATSTVTETVTETQFALGKRSHVRRDKVEGRAAAPVITPKAVLPKRMLHHARQAASSGTATLDVSALGSALSSACSCRSVRPDVTYLPFTADPATRTIAATDYRTLTLNSTVPGGVTTITTTVNVTSTIRPTGTGGYTMPPHSQNDTMIGTASSHSRKWSKTRSGWPMPTNNSSCYPMPTGYMNSTVTITDISTSTETETETETVFETDTVSVITYANRTVTDTGVTVTEPGVTITEAGTTTTVTEEAETTITVTFYPPDRR